MVGTGARRAVRHLPRISSQELQRAPLPIQCPSVTALYKHQCENNPVLRLAVLSLRGVPAGTSPTRLTPWRHIATKVFGKLEYQTPAS